MLVPLVELRPCERRCFLFFSLELELGTDSFALPAAEAPLFTSPELSLPTPVETDAPPRLGTALDELSAGASLVEEPCCSWACGAFLLVSPGGVVLLAGLLLGSVLLDDELFDELPGRALLF